VTGGNIERGTPCVAMVLSGTDMTTTALSGLFDTSELPRLAPDPVTITVAREIVPGREPEFEAWAETMAERVADFPGSLGTGILRPGPDGGPYQIVFRFVDALSLRLWERSPQRATLLAEADNLVTGTRVQRTVGVEQWFELPERAEPPRGFVQRLFTDVAWVYPVALVVSVTLAPSLGRLPLGVRTLLSAGIITLVMQAGVGPIRKRLRARRRFG
jgi:uncharacterized protein